MQIETYLQNRKKFLQNHPEELFSTRGRQQSDEKENEHRNGKSGKSGAASLQEVVQQQRQTIVALKKELQQKLINHGFANYFKTLNSSQELSHIDIYLQLVSIKPKIRQQDMQIKALESKLEEREREAAGLKQDLLILEQESTCEKERYEAEFRKAAEAIRKAHQRILKLNDELRRSGDDSERYHQLKLLSDQIEKQRLALISKNKELAEQLVAAQERQRGLIDSTYRERELLGRADERADRAEQQLARARRQVKEFSNINKELAGRIEHYQLQLSQLEERTERERGALEEMARKAREESLNNEQDCSRVQDRIRQLECELEQETNKARALEARLKSLQRERREESQQSEKQLQEAAETNRKLKEGNSRLANQNQMLASEMKLINQRCAKLRSSLLCRQEEMVELRGEVSRLSAQLKQEQTQLNRAEKERELLQVSLQQLSAELGSPEDPVQSLQELKDRVAELGLFDELKEELLGRLAGLLPKQAQQLMAQYRQLLTRVANGCSEQQFESLGHRKRQLLIEMEGVSDDLACKEAYLRNLESKYSELQRELGEQSKRDRRPPQKKPEESVSKREMVKRYLK